MRRDDQQRQSTPTTAARGPWLLLFGLLCCCGACRTIEPSVASQADLDAVADSEPSPIVLVAFDAPAMSVPTDDPPPIGPSLPPLSLRELEQFDALSPDKKLPIDMNFVVQQAVAHATVILDPNGFLSPASALLASPESVASSLDPNIYATSDYGVEAALAAFDTQLAIGAQWGQNSLVQTNNFFAGNVAPGNLLVSDSGAIIGRLDRPTQTGGAISFVNNWNYNPSNLSNSSLNSPYISFLRSEIRQPLWAGRGSDFTDISGPISRTRGQLGRGVRTAQIDEQIAGSQFELRLQQHFKQVQNAYWDLWHAHRDRECLAASSDSARELFERVQTRASFGLSGGNLAEEAQVEEAYLQRQTATRDAVAALLDRETRLRRLIGLTDHNARLLVPDAQPFTGEVILDWHASTSIASASRLELQQQQWRVENLEAQFRAADSLTQPQLDLVAGAQLNGFGDDALGINNNSAYESLFGGDNTGWNVGLEFSTTLGQRASTTKRRHIMQKLAKAREVFVVQQQEVQRELQHAFREVERSYLSLQTADQRRVAALRRVQAADAEFEAGRSSVDLVLRAQTAVADADRAYFASMSNYAKAFVELKYREGTMMNEFEALFAAMRPGPAAR